MSVFKKATQLRYVTSGLLGLAFFFLFTFFILSRPLRFRLVACDVGQGDAILLTYGQSHVLIDSGPNESILRCLQANIFWGDKNIDAVIITHGDNDHIGGLSSVAQQYHLEQLFLNGSSKSRSTWEKVPESRRKKTAVITPTIGSSLVIPGFRHRLVWNEQSNQAWFPDESSEDDENDISLGTFSLGRSFGFLSLGDLDCPRELAVTSIGLLSNVSILKTSHHGSKFSSCPQFLQKIHPETALISVGTGNSYGHPGEKVLLSLEELGTLVLRTDLLGEIVLWREPLLWTREARK